MKRIKVILLSILILWGNTIFAQTSSVPHLGDSAFASVLTCGPGDEFYTTFGHSAIRICDPQQHIDVVYNYGVFNFDVPHFYWKFAKGYLNYRIDRASFASFMMEYQYEGRAVWEQKLNITNQELNNMFVFLEWNNLPENRYYQYDFFKDNCATRVRDVVSNSLIHRSAFTNQEIETNESFRDILYQSTEENLLWWRFGIDMVLGVRCDKKTTAMEQMFSPNLMMYQLDTLTLSDCGQPLVESHQQILQETRTPLHRSISPTVTFWCLFVVVLSFTIIGWVKNWNLKRMDIIIFVVIGLMSILIMFLWFFSQHYCTKVNLNLLWCSPLFLYFAIRLRKSNRVVIAIQMMLLILTIAGSWFLPQQFNEAVIPIALLLFVRLLDKFRLIK